MFYSCINICVPRRLETTVHYISFWASQLFKDSSGVVVASRSKQTNFITVQVEKETYIKTYEYWSECQGFLVHTNIESCIAFGCWHCENIESLLQKFIGGQFEGCSEGNFGAYGTMLQIQRGYWNSEGTYHR